MSFDVSRVTFDPWKDFSSVVMQQGRVQLDSEWNEWLAEFFRRTRAGTYDCFGHAVYPATTPNAFRITPTGTPMTSLTIGVGRMYVDGLLAENHGGPLPSSGGWIPPTPPAAGAQPSWDAALDEQVGVNAIDYLSQPYFPGASRQKPFPTSGGPFLVYLDVWERDVTFVQDPDLIEKAVTFDTAGRMQTVWQVRLLDLTNTTGVTCATNDADIPSWAERIQPSAGRLTTGLVQSSPSGPCCLAPNTGFTGLENQLYRVEIHQADQSGTPLTFKWSSNNASLATRVLAISADLKTLTVESTGRDNVMRFNVGDWVEITDDWLELNGEAGELRRVALVTDSNNTIALETPLDPGNFPVTTPAGATDPNRHTRVRKWDQKGKVFGSDGTTVWKDLDAAGSKGDIDVPPPGTAVILENGITVAFDRNPSDGKFHVGDYWNFAARTVDGSVENLQQAPPRGTHHHYVRLAIIGFDATPSDCRVEWPPATGEAGCDCAACVTATGHNSGAFTIQQAIDAVQRQGGGKVCLGPGVYNIDRTIVIASPPPSDAPPNPAQNIFVAGHGLPLLMPSAQLEGALISIGNAIDIDIEGVAFAGGPPGNSDAPPTRMGVSIVSSAFVRIQRCAFGQTVDAVQLSPAIALGGVPVLSCAVRGSLFNNVGNGIGLFAAQVQTFITQLAIEDNYFYTSGAGVILTNIGDAPLPLISEVRYARNFLRGIAGFIAAGIGADMVVEGNSFIIPAASLPSIVSTNNAVGSLNVGVAFNIPQTRVSNNQISGVASALTVTQQPGQTLAAGTYSWIVTAIDMRKRESLATLIAIQQFTAATNVTLSWPSVPNAVSYNIYRTAANDPALKFDGSTPQQSGPTITFPDQTPDANLTTPIPLMVNRGIKAGAIAQVPLFGTALTGNHIGLLTGSGIVVAPDAGAAASDLLIADNELFQLGGSGIVYSTGEGGSISGALIVSRNSISDAGVLGVNDGAATSTPFAAMQMNFLGVSDLQVCNNVVRRSSVPPSTPDAPPFLAFAVISRIGAARVDGNLFDSFGKSQPNTLGTVAVQIPGGSCLFTSNQCVYNSSANTPGVFAVGITVGRPLVVSNNVVKGPAFNATPSINLIVNFITDTLPVTVLGNVTTNGILLNGKPLGPPWQPLNVQAPF